MCQIAERTFYGFAGVQAHRASLPAIQTDRSSGNAPQTTPQVTPLFTVARFVVGTGIDEKEPVGVAKSFPASTEKVFCYLEATGIAKDTKISFVWIYKQKEMLKTTMTLKSGDKWRTYSNKNLRGLKGDWEVQLISSTGAVIKDVKFKVE